jgi:hypothetical protein
MVGALVTALVSPALASDTLEGTRGPVTEREHTVRITLDRGHASLVVRRTVLNGGERHDQAVYYLGMPPGAVAVGLRTRGISQGKPVWFAGDLLEAEAAAAKYRELTGVGGFYPKDPALLSWRDQDMLALQVFPVPPGESKTVEYTLVRPMRYEGGRFRLDVPLGGVDCARQEVRIVAAHAEDSLWLNDQPFPSGGLVVRPAVLANAAVPEGACEEEDLRLGLSRRAAPALDGRLAVQGFARDRVLVHYQVEAAARLSSVPERAHIVVLLDDSRSMTTDQQAAGTKAITQVLQRLPEAQVAVLAFHRKVVPLFPGFRPGVLAKQALRDYQRQRENGSRLDDALRRADELLAKTPPGVRRIYVLSDLRTRNALDPSSVAALVRRSGALVHIGRIEDGSPELKPDKEGPWAKVARSTGGLLWQGLARGEMWKWRT